MMTPTMCTIPVKVELQQEPRVCVPRKEVTIDPRAQNVFGIFNAASIERVARKSANAMLRTLSPGADAPSVLINLRAAVGDSSTASAMLLCGHQVDRLADSDTIVIATLSIEPTLDARDALHLRSPSMPLKCSAHYGMANAKAFGKSENCAIYRNEVTDPVRFGNYALIGRHFAQPRLLLSRVELRLPVVTRLFIGAKAAAARAATPAASSNSGTSGGKKNSTSDNRPTPFGHELCQQQRAEWFAAVLAARAFKVSCQLFGPLSKQQLLTQSARIDLPFAPTDEPIDALTWQRATAHVSASAEPPATWPYVIYDPAFMFPPEPSPPVSSHPPRQADRPAAGANDNQAAAGADQLLAAVASRPTDASTYGADRAQPSERPAAVAARDDPSESAAPVVMVRAYEPLRYFARHVRLAELTIYEIETYARARLHWHIVRLSRQERAGCGDDEWLDRGAASSRYPQTSGAQRALLRMIGADVAEREEHHEAIGLGVLALVAAPQPALRDNLLYLEALAIEARSCADRDSINEEVATHLQLLERFWDMCGPVVYSAASASTLERVMASIAADWQSGLAAVVVN